MKNIVWVPLLFMFLLSGCQVQMMPQRPATNDRFPSGIATRDDVAEVRRELRAVDNDVRQMQAQLQKRHLEAADLRARLSSLETWLMIAIVGLVLEVVGMAIVFHVLETRIHEL